MDNKIGTGLACIMGLMHAHRWSYEGGQSTAAPSNDADGRLALLRQGGAREMRAAPAVVGAPETLSAEPAALNS